MALFGRFRKLVQESSRLVPSAAPPEAALQTAQVGNSDRSLREQIGSLYDIGVSPLHAIRAMIHDADGELITSVYRSVDVWLGINDLLCRDSIKDALRSQLIDIRDSLGNTIECYVNEHKDAVPDLENFIAKYRELSRRESEMVFLQSFNIIDGAGNVVLAALEKMLSVIEYEKANNPGSRAQDVSVETLKKLYLLRDNWDDPTKLRAE